MRLAMVDTILIIIFLSGVGLIVTWGVLGITMICRANDLLPENPKGSRSQVTWGMVHAYARLRPHSVLPRLANICLWLGLGLALIGVITQATGW
jgi:hypothetical protein